MPEEIKQEVVLKTQKYLGKYVKKPPLSEKLLKKPPFRFLHDIVNTVIKETGFLKGLFSEEELNSENIKEKDAKIAFLNKLIDAVKNITNTDLAVRPSKIVAGLEPVETNLLLQTIGKAIEKKLDSSEYVNQLQSGQTVADKNKKSKKSEKSDKPKKSSKTVANSDEKAKTTPRKNEKTTKSSTETPKSTDRTKPKRTSKESKSKTGSDDAKSKTKDKDKLKKKEKSKEENKETAQALENVDPPKNITKEHAENGEDEVKDLKIPTTDLIDNNRSAADEEETIKSSTEPQTIASTDVPPDDAENEIKRKRNASASRPKSARPRSGDVKEKSQENTEPAPQPIQRRPGSSLRPPSVRPSSARPGAPRLRPDSGFPIKEVVPMGKINVIVESFDKDIDDEETVVIQSNPEVVEEQNENIEVPGDNKGHLVEQILEQISESDDKLQAVKTDEWQKDGFQGKDSITKETNNLRSLIQTLTKTANPLGKLLNYLHEDIDAMHAELESWTNAKRQLFDEIAKQKKVSLEMNKPLTSQLEHLNQETKKVEEEIISTRSNILRNDLKIKELLSK